MGFLDLFRRGPALTDRSKVDGLRYADLQVCAEMTKLGFDLREPVHSLFYLYFPNKTAADAAAADLAARGLSVGVREPWSDGEVKVEQWGVIAESRVNALIPDFLRETVDACEAVAAAHGGEYDGWEAGPADGGLGSSAD